ncbi:restriction endonuclease subunit S [Flavobacterium sp. MMS24-S5]|uniref:restriction endonuclease subunit S n=1 Tax=Flavobacterium sp. MMS24-S5 TaxID=3416605 RepID=UPI003D087BF6
MNLDKSNLSLPTKWQSVKISDVLTLGSGKDYKHLQHGTIPVYGTGGYMTSVNEYLYDGESVGIGRKGTIDKPVFLTGKFWTVDTLFYTHSFKNAIPYFIYLVFQSINWRKYSEATGVPSLSKNIIEPIKILLPPLQEQQKIAEILSTVDDKIEIIDQQITETQELKKGLMQRLLTKGIGHTEFKDSPLGMIPESWGVVQVQEVSKVIDSLHKTPVFSDEGYPMVRVGDINKDILNLKNCLKVSKDVLDDFNKNHQPKIGDILMTRVGSFGKTTLIRTEEIFCLGQNTVVITSMQNPEFLYQIFNSSQIQKQLNLLTNGSSQPSLSLKDIRNLQILFPPKKEQKQIANILSSVDDKLEVLAEKKLNYQELKRGLIQQLLTGKIRVNGIFN